MTKILPVIEKNLAREGMYQEEWQLLRLHYDYTLLFMRALELLEQGDMEGSTEEAKKLIDLIRRNEMEAQKVLDVHNTVLVISRAWKLEEA
jgi:hypothetical protein